MGSLGEAEAKRRMENCLLRILEDKTSKRGLDVEHSARMLLKAFRKLNSTKERPCRRPMADVALRCLSKKSLLCDSSDGPIGLEEECVLEDEKNVVAASVSLRENGKRDVTREVCVEMTKQNHVVQFLNIVLSAERSEVIDETQAVGTPSAFFSFLSKLVLIQSCGPFRNGENSR